MLNILKKKLQLRFFKHHQGAQEYDMNWSSTTWSHGGHREFQNFVRKKQMFVMEPKISQNQSFLL